MSGYFNTEEDGLAVKFAVSRFFFVGLCHRWIHMDEKPTDVTTLKTKHLHGGAT